MIKGIVMPQPHSPPGQSLKLWMKEGLDCQKVFKIIKGIVMAMTTPTTKTIADVVDEGGTGLDCHAIVLMMKRRKQDVGSKSLDRL